MFKKWLAYQMVKRGAKKKPLKPEFLESKQVELDRPNFNDSSYFFGRNEEGFGLVSRLSFRTAKPNEFWLAFIIPGQGAYRLLDLKQEEGEGFKLDSLEYRCEEVAQRWKILYQGKMHAEKENKEVDVRLSLNFEATQEIFDFSGGVDPRKMADTLAQTKWSKSFFQKLKEIRQVHYEQTGSLKGEIQVEEQSYKLNLRSMRDHSFGTRIWKSWIRHIWFSAVLDNGDSFNISMIRYDFLPITFRAGYLSRGGKFSPIKDCSSFEEISQDELRPSKLDITFSTSDESDLKLSIQIDDNIAFWMDEKDYRIIEGVARFQLEEESGIGIAEFGFNPEKYPKILEYKF